MNQDRPELGTKRTCSNCQSRFYDLARAPAICPKCGAEYAEIVRPARIRPPIRKYPAFGKGRPGQPFAAGFARDLPASEARPEDDDREAAEEKEEAPDDEAEQETEVADLEE